MNVAEPLALPTIDEDLQRLEPLLSESVVTGDSFLDDVTTHLITAGGKRLRPVLTLAAATSDGRRASREDLLGAISVELVHLASLYHDDVMDEATVRRNVPSVNARFGNLVAIVAGDFLLARSAEIAASLGTEVAALLATTLAELCRGQVAEVRSTYQVGRTEDEYLNAISGKTAALMATSCRIGALTAGLPTTQVEALTTFGRSFGMIFQIRDDILDVVGSEMELGKPAGQDLAEGIYTLPVLKALIDPDVGPELRSLLGQPLDQPERDKARSFVGESGAIAQSIAVGRTFADEAGRAAAGCSSPELATGFARLAHSLIDDLPAG